ncbi:TIGR02680 family protein [Amycolatopsis suaedae]|uniref:TIGR02680 family protein n=1 Tax=Amycolatopsis suaedae TaxID=2510978 RepID=A0A4Q7J8U7_9PSEU|nr:TIGR02680 family protein [Amycolatopsis suaedae]RZQ63346.1 TIGR02680 family protein [Amycolatopsis suaedae]
MTVTDLPRRGAAEPLARTPRWTPTRAGILNVWRYYDEVFEFHHGRLLLRGPNGSGKSKALELLLPFLFDANLRANRLSTFGTGERTMYWNLMGEGTSATSRVGYVWLEFRSPTGRWFTCGARLQASAHNTTVHPDYFTTDLRIGENLSLVTESGQPLTRPALEERLGTRGAVHATANDYRTAVRTVLFPRLTEQRYDALITALLQLRMPKLSQRLDPALLSTLLSRALPPLGQQEIADLAEGFERLDAQRDRLKRLEDEVAAAKTLAARQKTYAQRVLRSGAAALLSADAELGELTATAQRSAEAYDEAERRRSAAEARVRSLGKDIDAAEARRAGLTESPDYRSGRELDRLRRRTADAAALAARTRRDAVRLRADAESDAEAERQAQHDVTRQAGAVRSRDDDVRTAAGRAGLASVHAEAKANLASGRARPLLRAAVRNRQDQLALVQRALSAHELAVERRQQAEAELDLARAEVAGAQDRVDAAAEDRERARVALGGRLLEWASDCRELVFEDPSALLDHVEPEVALLDVVDAAAATALREVIEQETVLRARLRIAKADRHELVAEIHLLNAEQELPPEPPSTQTTDRSRMVGAPLWRLVDFARDTPEDWHAGIEAALEGSGLLTAWVGYRGDVEGHDVFADPDALRSVPGRSLADVLVSERDTEVQPRVVTQLLSAIAFGDRLPPDGPAAVGADGTWRLGNLTGSWHKDEAEHIGSRARRRARQHRIDEHRARISEEDGVIADLERELMTLETRRLAIQTERATRPDRSELADAARRQAVAEAELGAANTVVAQRVETVSAAERAVSRALHDLTSLAAENGLPTDRSALSVVDTSVRSFADQADSWLDEHTRLAGAKATLEVVADRARRSADNAKAREAEAEEAEARHAELATTLAAVEETVGVDHGRVLAETDALRTKLIDLRSELDAANREVYELSTQLGWLDSQRTTDASARDAGAARRNEAARRFRAVATGVFPADSGIDDLPRFQSALSASEGIDAALEAARTIATAWPSVPHAPNNLTDALHRLSESIHASRDTLKSRTDLDLEADGDVQVFTALVDGVRVGAAELLEILRAEAEQTRQEISERERRLFDQTLTGDTRRHLAARIRQASELVTDMNARLERVRTASRLAVRLEWEVAEDLPPGTRSARDLLLLEPDQLSDADRQTLHRFFRERVEQAKADDSATSWEQQLAQVFDYTSWHRFVVKVDRGGGMGWQLLTRKLHGALSGGEKAIALHLPLFAALAAHYQAVPEAPRIILLDEVFVGVDTTNRGQVFALLSALDLDLMLTSDHEWCTYSELSGVSIHQLITGGDGDDAVTTAHFTWNGMELLPE